MPCDRLVKVLGRDSPIQAPLGCGNGDVVACHRCLQGCPSHTRRQWPRQSRWPIWRSRVHLQAALDVRARNPRPRAPIAGSSGRLHTCMCHPARSFTPPIRMCCSPGSAKQRSRWWPYWAVTAATTRARAEASLVLARFSARSSRHRGRQARQGIRSASWMFAFSRSAREQGDLAGGAVDGGKPGTVGRRRSPAPDGTRSPWARRGRWRSRPRTDRPRCVR